MNVFIYQKNESFKLMTFIISSCQKHVSKQLFLKKINIPDYFLQGKDDIFKSQKPLIKKTKTKPTKPNMLWKQHWECLEMFSLLYDFINENAACLSLKFSYLNALESGKQKF